MRMGIRTSASEEPREIMTPRGISLFIGFASLCFVTWCSAADAQTLAGVQGKNWDRKTVAGYPGNHVQVIANASTVNPGGGAQIAVEIFVDGRSLGANWGGGSSIAQTVSLADSGGHEIILKCDNRQADSATCLLSIVGDTPPPPAPIAPPAKISKPKPKPKKVPPDIKAAITRHVGETRCFEARALGTRSMNDPDDPAPRYMTTVEIKNTCSRDQIVEVLMDPSFIGEDHGFRRPIISGFWGNRHVWQPGLAAVPVPWQAMNPLTTGLPAPGGSVGTVDILQAAASWRDIKVEVASCNAVHNERNTSSYKAMLVEDHAFGTGFARISCPAIPAPGLSQQDRDVLAKLVAVSKTPAGEDPLATRCYNRDAALSVADVESNCRQLAEASKDPATQSLALYNAARLRLLSGDFASALELSQKALALKPTASLYNNMGVAYSETRLYVEAAANFQKALDLDPKHPTAARSLANMTDFINHPERRPPTKPVFTAARVPSSPAPSIGPKNPDDPNIRSTGWTLEKTLSVGEALSGITSLPEFKDVYLTIIYHPESPNTQTIQEIRRILVSAGVDATTIKTTAAFSDRYDLLMFWIATCENTKPGSYESPSECPR